MNAIGTRLIILSFIGLLAMGATSAVFGEENERVRSFAGKSMTDNEMDEVEGGGMQAPDIALTLVFFGKHSKVVSLNVPQLDLSAVKVRLPSVKVARINFQNLSLTRVKVGNSLKGLSLNLNP